MKQQEEDIWDGGWDLRLETDCSNNTTINSTEKLKRWKRLEQQKNNANGHKIKAVFGAFGVFWYKFYCNVLRFLVVVGLSSPTLSRHISISLRKEITYKYAYINHSSYLSLQSWYCDHRRRASITPHSPSLFIYQTF